MPSLLDFFLHKYNQNIEKKKEKEKARFEEMHRMKGFGWRPRREGVAYFLA